MSIDADLLNLAGLVCGWTGTGSIAYSFGSPWTRQRYVLVGAFLLGLGLVLMAAGTPA